MSRCDLVLTVLECGHQAESREQIVPAQAPVAAHPATAPTSAASHALPAPPAGCPRLQRARCWGSAAGSCIANSSQTRRESTLVFDVSLCLIQMSHCRAATSPLLGLCGRTALLARAHFDRIQPCIGADLCRYAAQDGHLLTCASDMHTWLHSLGLRILQNIAHGKAMDGVRLPSANSASGSRPTAASPLSDISSSSATVANAPDSGACCTGHVFCRFRM